MSFCRVLLTLIAVVAGRATAADVTPFSVSGDARLRQEYIEVEPGDDTERQRYRARLALSGGVSGTLTAHMRLATGTGDPVSTNLNFGESFTAENIRLDRAYLDWRVNDVVKLFAGKMKNPLYRPGDSSLVWDGDFNPEGAAAGLAGDAWFGTTGVYRVAGQAGADSYLYVAQGAGKWKLANDGLLTAGLSYYDYGHTRGRTPFYRARPSGNSVDADGNYLYDYDIVELFASYQTAVGDLPVEVFAEWVRNLDANRENRGFAAGARAGGTDEPGQFAISWQWHDTEADALIGTFTESDLAGGNTDSRGHLIQAEYAITPHLVAGATLILSEFGHFTNDVHDFDRVMLDLEFHF